MKLPSKKALDLILEYEVGGGKSYYDKFLAKPTWPGGASGLTLGIGVDCAYYTTQELEKLFYFLPEKQIEIVKNASGKKGLQGKEYTQKYKNSGIIVTWEHAILMFNELTWSKFSRLAEKTFPELDKLCDDAYGAIVSLVFNRGSSLVGDSRIEMRKIKNLIPQKNYKEIAKQIRDMKRLWIGKNLDGLLSRREDEAKLVESCM
jgi:hypothetical protein